MKKVLSIVLVVVMFLLCVPLTASAENTQSFSFELSVDGSDTKEVQTGDVITVLLRLKRTDSAEAYMMYAMQDEILYDSDFFELIEGSIVLAENITTTDIGLRDNHRAFYMNYLSMSDGEQWAADMLIGSFQLRVVGTSGVTRITNNNYLVSTSDGRESYPCQVNEVTIILSTECIVRFESNGGSEIEEQKVLFGEKVVKPGTDGIGTLIKRKAGILTTIRYREICHYMQSGYRSQGEYLLRRIQIITAIHWTG